MTLFKLKIIAFILGIAAFIGFIYFGQFGFLYCSVKTCSKSTTIMTDRHFVGFGNQSVSHGNLSFQEDKSNVHQDEFDIEDDDVLVFLHIQKTGGTYFGRNLVKTLKVVSPCRCFRNKKRCECVTRNRNIWLFSRYSTGWACGLHADWTELTGCDIDKKIDAIEGKHRQRRYHYITYLRDPIKRYISEWKHVARGATWKGAMLMCGGRQATFEEVQFCFEDSDWRNVSLEEFLACPHNLANNRQTRMLANLTKVNCYNTSAMSQEIREATILQSAKENLRNMSFFGITEFQKHSQYLFEKTFNMSFIKDFEQKSGSSSDNINIEGSMYEQIKDRNKLDIQLYEYAKQLFFARIDNL